MPEDAQEERKSELNPFESDMSQYTDEPYKSWPSVKEAAMQALERDEVDAWKGAHKKCVKFRS